MLEREPDIDAALDAPAALVAPVEARELAAIFAGGALGAVGRAGLAELLPTAPGAWPWATFAVNMLAAFVLAFAVLWIGERRPRTMYARAFWATGVCGALSTFSTVMIELVHLRERAGWGLACGYGLASVAGGIAAVLLGISLGRRLRPRMPGP